ncbi:MAG: hypothetical protein RG741_02595 [Bacteroidales bacterium]|nr:hypothetical protein [Bacteroidales bacterium]
MEDFVYIILIIVWLLVSFLRKKPKTQKQREKPEPSAQPEAVPAEEELSMEEMLQEFLGGKKQQKQEAGSKTTPDIATDQGTVDPKFEQHVGQEGVSEDFEFATEGKIETIDDLIKSHKTQEALALAKAEDEYGSESSGDIPEFDLRTAVIFSEILNKKYS